MAQSFFSSSKPLLSLSISSPRSMARPVCCFSPSWSLRKPAVWRWLITAIRIECWKKKSVSTRLQQITNKSRVANLHQSKKSEAARRVNACNQNEIIWPRRLNACNQEEWMHVTKWNNMTNSAKQQQKTTQHSFTWRTYQQLEVTLGKSVSANSKQQLQTTQAQSTNKTSLIIDFLPNYGLIAWLYHNFTIIKHHNSTITKDQTLTIKHHNFIKHQISEF